MARRGRELEELVATLEKGLNGTGIKVTSPDKIYDKVTKRKREIDVSLKGNMGFHDMFAILECRKRKHKDDVTWIEQLAIKRDHTGANLAIAISSSGFTEGARLKADFLGIRLRTVSEIDPQEIMDWFKAEKLTISCLHYALIEVFFVPHESINSSRIEEFQKFIKSFSGTSINYIKLLVDLESNEALSLDDCISRRSDKIIEHFKPTNEKKVIEINVIPRNEIFGFYFKTPEIQIRLKNIHFKLEIWLECKEVPFDSFLSYNNENNSLAQIVSVTDFEISGIKRSLTMYRTPKNDMQQIEIFFKDLI